MAANPRPLGPATTGEYLAGRGVTAAAGLLAEPAPAGHCRHPD